MDLIPGKPSKMQDHTQKKMKTKNRKRSERKKKGSLKCVTLEEYKKGYDSSLKEVVQEKTKTLIDCKRTNNLNSTSNNDINQNNDINNPKENVSERLVNETKYANRDNTLPKESKTKDYTQNIKKKKNRSREERKLIKSLKLVVQEHEVVCKDHVQEYEKICDASQKEDIEKKTKIFKGSNKKDENISTFSNACNQNNDTNKSEEKIVERCIKEASKETVTYSAAESNTDDKQNITLNNACNQNIKTKKYEMHVCDKLTKEVKCINQETKEESSCDTDSNSDNETSDEMGKKLISTEDSQSESKVKEEYKQNICNKLKRDIEDGNQETVASSDVINGNVEESGLVESLINNMKQNICTGCDKKQCNATASPCGHCYLCHDCAKRILRIYPKCSICHANIKEFKY